MSLDHYLLATIIVLQLHVIADRKGHAGATVDLVSTLLGVLFAGLIVNVTGLVIP